ncbi:MAG TPA: hypothetical protein VFN42_11875 [Acetobacteraceae bacterium]|nr:hypothetical protein [Acetobacteraceae bacterium]
MRACLALCGLESVASEQSLACGDGDKLRTAAGFVYGAMLSGALWSAIVLVAWSLIA